MISTSCRSVVDAFHQYNRFTTYNKLTCEIGNRDELRVCLASAGQLAARLMLHYGVEWTIETTATGPERARRLPYGREPLNTARPVAPGKVVEATIAAIAEDTKNPVLAAIETSVARHPGIWAAVEASIDFKPETWAELVTTAERVVAKTNGAVTQPEAIAELLLTGVDQAHQVTGSVTATELNRTR